MGSRMGSKEPRLCREAAQTLHGLVFACDKLELAPNLFGVPSEPVWGPSEYIWGPSEPSWDTSQPIWGQSEPVRSPPEPDYEALLSPLAKFGNLNFQKFDLNIHISGLMPYVMIEDITKQNC